MKAVALTTHVCNMKPMRIDEDAVQEVCNTSKLTQITV